MRKFETKKELNITHGLYNNNTTKYEKNRRKNFKKCVLLTYN